jgi:hypothetical protein
MKVLDLSAITFLNREEYFLLERLESVILEAGYTHIECGYTGNLFLVQEYLDYWTAVLFEPEVSDKQDALRDDVAESELPGWVTEQYGNDRAYEEFRERYPDSNDTLNF